MAVTTASPEISIEDARGFIYGAIASYNERVDPNIVLEPAQVDALAHQFMTLPTSLEIPQEFLTSAEGLPIDSMSGAGDDLQPRAQLLYNLALQGLVDSVAGTAFAQIQERAAEIRERVEEGYRQVTTVMATVTASSNDWFSTDNWSDPDYWNGFDGIYATAEFQAYAARIAEHLEENPAARERIDAAASGTADALERGDHDAVRAGVDEITDELDGLEEGADPEHTKAAAIHIAATKIASQDPEFNSLSKEEQSARIQRYVTELEEIVAADPERLATLEGAMEKTRPVEEAIERIEGEMGKYLAESQIIEENVVRNGCYYTIEGFLNYNADLGYHLVDEKGEVNVYDASVLVEKSPEELITWVRDRDLLSSLDEGSREALSSYGFDPDDPDAVIAGIKEYQRLEAGPITDRGIEYLELSDMVGTLTESPLLINETLQAYHTADVKLYNEIYPEHAAELDALEVQLEAQEAERTSIWEDIYAWFEDDEAGAQQGADASATAADGAETFALDGLDPEQAFLDDNRDALFAQLQTLIAEGKSPDEAIVALGHTIQSTPATGVDAAQLYTVLARDNQFSGMVADIEQNGAQISAPTPTVAGPTNTFVLNS